MALPEYRDFLRCEYRLAGDDPRNSAELQNGLSALIAAQQ
jgi:hypothetical protein